MSFLRQTSRLNCLRASHPPSIARYRLKLVKSPALQHLRRPFNTSIPRHRYFRPGDREVPRRKDQQTHQEYDGGADRNPEPPSKFQQFFNTPNIIVGGLMGACIGVYGYAALVSSAVRTQASSEATARMQWLHDHFVHSLKNMKEGRYYTLVTSAFMHQSVIHLTMNMIGLWGFGRFFASGFGTPAFLVLYFGSVVAGGLAQNYVWEKRGEWNAGGLGASGGVLGVFAATACIVPRGQMGLLLIPMPMWLGAALMVGLSVGGLQGRWLPTLGHADHLGGMAFGALWWLIALRRGRYYRR